jgi:hypothetical protein
MLRGEKPSRTLGGFKGFSWGKFGNSGIILGYFGIIFRRKSVERGCRAL